MSGKNDDAPPAYGAPPQQPQAAYQGGAGGGYPPQGPYGHDQNYQANPGMAYYQQVPPQGQYPGGPYPPQQQGYYPPQQGYPQGQYQQQQQQSGSGAEGCLGILVGMLACCCCLDCLF